MRVPGKVFVVTGGGNGIGREVVRALLDRGARVAAVDVSADGLAGTASAVALAGERLTTHVVDLTDRAAVEALPEAVISAHGAVDGVLLVAGIIQPFLRIADLPIEKLQRVMDVNFYGPVHMVKAFLPHLRTRPEAHLVGVSSMGGFVPVPGQTGYGASKAALKLLFEGLHGELADTPVRVTVVFPGAVGTNIAVNSGALNPAVEAAMKASSNAPMLTAAEAARQILDAMEANRFRATVGKDAWFLDVLSRLAPARAAAFVARQMKSLLGG